MNERKTVGSEMMSEEVRFFDGVILTEKEKEEAILEGKKKKYFKEKNKDHWKDDPDLKSENKSENP